MSTTSYQTLTREISTNLASLRSGLPDMMQSFAALGKTAMMPGTLDAKTKELIALALGVAARCDGCIGFHTKALVRLGATAEEVHEALGIAIYMGGGPSAMYAANAVAAFEEFSTSKPQAAQIAG
ncbi:4-carboxymuconolactone decarboxylase [Methylophilaceae bacterium]|nr:4-carboxymuconolactone decarboxylase [Methylophilaceae bacterium]